MSTEALLILRVSLFVFFHELGPAALPSDNITELFLIEVVFYPGSPEVLVLLAFEPGKGVPFEICDQRAVHGDLV